jgi:hypothetical protein
MTNINLSSDNIIQWFNMIRDLPDSERTRSLDAFWDGQMHSKIWLSEVLNKHYDNPTPSNIYIFGGWLGVLANILFQNSNFYVDTIYNIDVDPWCKSNSEKLNATYVNMQRFQAETTDMKDYQYNDTADIVINTSTEHVDQETYDQWYDNIPSGSLVVVQGNDFFSCDEHVRCSKDLDEFMTMNRVHEPIFSGQLKTTMYNRFMCVFKKN